MRKPPTPLLSSALVARLWFGCCTVVLGGMIAPRVTCMCACGGLGSCGVWCVVYGPPSAV